MQANPISLSEGLMQRLPTVRGRYIPHAELAPLTWFRVGGLAEVLFKPQDEADLCHFLQNKPHDVPHCVLGVGSNVIVRDGGIPGVVIKLGRGFGEITVQDDQLSVGAACLDRTVAMTAAEAAVDGLTFLAGIPGTMGGAVRMNAGCYGSEIKDILVHARVVDLEGNIHTIGCADMDFKYRKSNLPHGWIVTAAVLQGKAGDPTDIFARINQHLAERELTQPVKSRTGGSTFKNPPEQSAWKLVDAAGCRGLVQGGAMVSGLHCNFLLNTGQATAGDIEALGDEVRRRVFETSGIMLEWEIERLGSKDSL